MHSMFIKVCPCPHSFCFLQRDKIKEKSYIVAQTQSHTVLFSKNRLSLV